VPTDSFSAFIGLLNTSLESKYEKVYQHVLEYLIDSRSSEFHGDVFAFSGNSDSGIGLLSLKQLPKDGFCFCGSIRIERNCQDKKMVIFKLTSSKDRYIELYIKSGYLHYLVLFIVKINRQEVKKKTTR